MKKIILLSLLLVSFVGYSQEVKTDSIHIKVDKMPKYKGGIKQFYKYIFLNYRPIVTDSTDNKMISSFVIDTDGSITDVKIIKDLGGNTGKELIKVLKKSPKWTSGKHNGKKVKVQFTLPLEIDIKELQVYSTKDVEVIASYPGGLMEFYKFFGKNYKKENIRGASSGKLIVSFIVEKDGSLSNFKVIQDVGYGTGDEAIRVLKLSKKWIPSSNKGKPLRVRFTLPVDLKL
ncbi:MAG: energy transducer TonB [Flavobacteriaceae bacterium]